jgi:hypothetical protein
MANPSSAHVILRPVPVALTERLCPTCDEAYQGTVLTERREAEIRSVTYSPCPKCGTVSSARVERGQSSGAALPSA